MAIFEKAEDYAAFERVMCAAAAHVDMRLLAYCLMPNHWHLVLWPRADGDLGRYMQRLTVTHVRRWHAHRDSVGFGHLYQGTYKSFPVQRDEHFLAVCRYVERNALRSGLVERAEAWRWCSLWRREHPKVVDNAPALGAWPVRCPNSWRRLVSRPQSEEDADAILLCIKRGRPFGSARWLKLTATRYGLQSTFRARGRPKKAEVWTKLYLSPFSVSGPRSRPPPAPRPGGFAGTSSSPLTVADNVRIPFSSPVHRSCLNPELAMDTPTDRTTVVASLFLVAFVVLVLATRLVVRDPGVPRAQPTPRQPYSPISAADQRLALRRWNHTTTDSDAWTLEVWTDATCTSAWGSPSFALAMPVQLASNNEGDVAPPPIVAHITLRRAEGGRAVRRCDREITLYRVPDRERCWEGVAEDILNLEAQVAVTE